MRLTLADNVKKLERVTQAVVGLSNPNIYYNSSYEPQEDCDRSNKQILIRTLKSMRRLIKVIEKQSNEEVRRIFPHFRSRYDFQIKDEIFNTLSKISPIRIGDSVIKKSGKPFKSGNKIEVVKSFGINEKDPKMRATAIFENGSDCNLDLLIKV